MTTRKFATGVLFVLTGINLIFPLWLEATGAQQTPPPPVPQSISTRMCVLYDFGSRPSDPIWQREPSPIAEGSDGYLYSTSTSGGTHGAGTVFKVSPTDGKPPVVLYNFDTIHGAGPQSGLTRGSDGNFYGTTYGGGKYGVGEIFSISPTGALTDLWDFRNGAVIPAPEGRLPTDQEKLDAAGSYPVSAPVQGSDGNWYGVTSYANNQQWGVVYQLSGAKYRGLYQFKPADAATIGNLPNSLSAGHDGNFYGTTLKGDLGWGSIYRVSGGSVSLLHQFDASVAGSISVMQGRDGRL